MLERYVDLIEVNGDRDAALQIATWTALSKGDHGTVSYLLQYSLRGYLSLLTRIVDETADFVPVQTLPSGEGNIDETAPTAAPLTEPDLQPAAPAVHAATPLSSADKLFQESFQLYRYGHKRLDVALRLEFERVLLILYRKTQFGFEQPLATGHRNIHALVKLCLKLPWVGAKKGKTKGHAQAASASQLPSSLERCESMDEPDVPQTQLESQPPVSSTDPILGEDFLHSAEPCFDAVEYI